jgi:hypothetical protein
VAADLPILQCNLDAAGARAQRDRYAHVSAGVTAISREDRSLIAALSPDVDAAVVDELVATERACCPFFDIGWDGSRLSFAVSAEHAAALDVIEEALRR